MLKQLIDEFSRTPGNVDGCSVGVQSVVTGNLILKPWKFYCSDPILAEALGQYRCDKQHEHSICQGKDTKLTGFYPRKSAKITVKGIFPKELKKV